MITNDQKVEMLLIMKSMLYFKEIDNIFFDVMTTLLDSKELYNLLVQWDKEVSNLETDTAKIVLGDIKDTVSQLSCQYEIVYQTENTTNTEMKRYNNGKPQMSYLGSIKDALVQLVHVFEYGTKKYDRDNWKLGGDKNMLLDCMGRHYLKLANGEELDEESQCEHAAHLAWNALAFLQLKHEGKLK